MIKDGLQNPSTQCLSLGGLSDLKAICKHWILGVLFPSDIDMKSVFMCVVSNTWRLFLSPLNEKASPEVKSIGFLDPFRGLLDAGTKHSSATGAWTLNSHLTCCRE